MDYKEKIIEVIKKEVDKYTGYIPYDKMEYYRESTKKIEVAVNLMLKQEFLNGYRQAIIEQAEEKSSKISIENE